MGFAWTSTGAQYEYRSEWIFHKTSLQYIGERDYDIKTGVVNGESAVLQRAFVDNAGQRPTSSKPKGDRPGAAGTAPGLCRVN